MAFLTQQNPGGIRPEYYPDEGLHTAADHQLFLKTFSDIYFTNIFSMNLFLHFHSMIFWEVAWANYVTSLTSCKWAVYTGSCSFFIIIILFLQCFLYTFEPDKLWYISLPKHLLENIMFTRKSVWKWVSHCMTQTIKTRLNFSVLAINLWKCILTGFTPSSFRD